MDGEKREVLTQSEDIGLSAPDAPMAMIPSFVSKLPDGSEKVSLPDITCAILTDATRALFLLLTWVELTSVSVP